MELVKQAEVNLRMMKQVWHHTREQWRDNTATYFEKNFWEEAEKETAGFIRALGELEKELEAIRRSVRRE